jgi:hypothetical protein
MSTYGQAGVTYGGTGTYGSWGITFTPTSGPFRRQRIVRRPIPRIVAPSGDELLILLL